MDILLVYVTADSIIKPTGARIAERYLDDRIVQYRSRLSTEAMKNYLKENNIIWVTTRENLSSGLVIK